MLHLLHLLFVAIYLLLPAGALAWAIREQRAGKKGALPTITVVFISGLAISVALNLIYATGTRGRPTAGQLFIAAYFATSMLVLLRLLDAGMQTGLRRLLRLKQTSRGVSAGLRVVLVQVVRVCVLMAIGLPYVMATILVYRAKVMPLDNPRTQLGFEFERVEFKTDDGVRIVGWWIAAAQPLRGRTRPENWGEDTALVCHGLAASKSNQLILARKLVPGGMNVLAFDFRAHGESGGQLASFGALEKRDVLAAVKWVKANHPQQSHRLFGVGASMGAAALISAAADDSAEGRAIDAIAAYATFDDLWDLALGLTKKQFAPPLDWLLPRLGLPLASLQTGADLVHYAPGRDIQKIWPRPVLLIHGEMDDVIPFERGEALLRAAWQPKYHLWFPEAKHNDVVADELAAQVVLEFFRVAHAVPVI